MGDLSSSIHLCQAPLGSVDLGVESDRGEDIVMGPLSEESGGFTPTPPELVFVQVAGGLHREVRTLGKRLSCDAKDLWT